MAEGDPRRWDNKAPTDPFVASGLEEYLAARLTEAQLDEVYRAYRLAAFSHRHQRRRSGEPYIYHPLAVARLVAELNMDHRSIMAAVLHDVLEDTETTREEMAAEFGEEVTVLVDGLSKLTNLSAKSKVEAQADNFRKMLLAMVDDIRVIVIKLADRLHNMRTLGSMPPHKRRRIARETLEVFAPIAHRLGITQIKNELEDLGLQALYPARYRVLGAAVQRARRNRKEMVQKIEVLIDARLREAGIDARVTGREKHLYSLYEKMRSRQLSFREVFDMFAIRIVAPNHDDCYRALGVVHSLYRPMPGLFKDYIAIPKVNGYQSLHTVLFSPHGVPIEVQIRTEEMDDFAERGIAAHWAYKTGASSATENRARQWLSNLMDMQRSSASSLEFYENVKVDLFPEEIYVFSPKGEIFRLPQNATPVDFAYAVHSDIGNRCVTVRVNRMLAALSTPLQSGQTVEILTSPSARPSPLWLNFVVTAKARSQIRHYLKNLDSRRAIAFGKRLLARGLERLDTVIEDVPQANIDSLLHDYHFGDLDQLYIDIGLGNHLPSLIAARLAPEAAAAAAERGDDGSAQQPHDVGPLVIEGGDGTVIQLARCCKPLPGDNIQGFLTSGKGVVVHRAGCSNIKKYRRRPKEWVPVEWSGEAGGSFQCDLSVEMLNRPGALARVATTLSNMDANIENLRFNNTGQNCLLLIFTLSVRDRKHLARIIRRLRNQGMVQRVGRESG